MGGSGELAARVAAPAGPAGAARRQQQRGAPPCTAAWPGWGRSEPPKELAKDPEAKFRQYGEDFGKNYFLQGVMESAPRVRVRTSRDRARDQLADLAVLNERLAGKGQSEAAAIRHRLEYLKKRRRNWEMVYQHVTRADALCTLSAIEDAAARVDELLSDESRERQSVTALKRQLVDLQGEVASAHERLHLTQARVEQNLQRINELKEESARLGDAVQRAQAQEAAASAAAAAADLAAAAAAAPAAIAAAQAQAQAAAADAPAAGVPQEAGVAPVPSALAAAVAASRAALAPGHAQNRGGRSSGPSGRGRLSLDQEVEAQRRRGLYSSLEMEEELKNHWFAVAFASKLQQEGAKVPFELFGQAWVLFRGADGRPACVLDECAHRACPLSIGRVVDGQLECAYHGWRFNSQGECTKMPSTMLCRGVAVSALPCAEADGFVWIWPGWEEPTAVPTFTRPPPGYRIHTEIEVEVPVEHGLLVENLLDLAHAPFTHTSTFARGWPVPDAVKFHASRLLGGNWDPYPIEMSFNPPCCTLSHVGLARPGKAGSGPTPQDCQNHLHQLHVCLPSRAGHTRLLYRMSTDFLWWTEWIPGIQRFWSHIAGQVLGEDLVLVEGQQDRLLRGGDTWRHPVSYDKLAVRYRRWRNSLVLNGTAAAAAMLRKEQDAEAGSGGAAAGAASAGAAGEPALTMRSGEIFGLEESDLEEDQLFVDLPASGTAPGAGGPGA